MINYEFNESERRKVYLSFIALSKLVMFIGILFMVIRLYNKIIWFTDAGLFKYSIKFNEYLTNAKSVHMGWNKTCVITTLDVAGCYD